MPTQPLKYCDYFKVDEKYFPCIDESAIRERARWDITYPHETFIKLLTHMEKMLSGGTGRSLWIHGDYGTGKSRCAFTLKKLLDVPEEELRAYWNKYEPLKQDQLLRNKFIGHRKQGIVPHTAMPPAPSPGRGSSSSRCRRDCKRHSRSTIQHTCAKTRSRMALSPGCRIRRTPTS